jgi:hypothetical protein
MSVPWSDFEEYVQEVYSILLNLRDEGVMVTRDATLFGRRSDTPHQIDVFYEFIRAGIRHRVAIECKCTARPTEKSEVSSFFAVVHDIGDVIGVMVSRSGYQSGAIKFAQTHNILALTVDDLPTIPLLAADFIGNFFLPDETEIAEPFWTIFKLDNEKNTGTYFPLGSKSSDGMPSEEMIPLFFSKKQAEAYLADIEACSGERGKWGVRGLPQRVLRGTLAFAHMRGTKFAIFNPFCWSDQDSPVIAAFRYTAEEVAQDYALKAIPFDDLGQHCRD